MFSLVLFLVHFFIIILPKITLVFLSANSLYYQWYYYKDGINIFVPHFIRGRGETPGDRVLFFWICFDLIWIGSLFSLCVAFLPFPFRASLSCYACCVCYKHVAALQPRRHSLHPLFVITIVLFPIGFYSMFVKGGAAIIQYLRACVCLY